MNKIDALLMELNVEKVNFYPLWSITIWDKKFKSVEKHKQTKVLKFIHVSAEKLKSIQFTDGDIELLSTGDYKAKTTLCFAKGIVNEGEIISIPSGGVANIKYYNGKFVDGGNILCCSIDNNKYNLKYIYYYLIKEKNFVQSCFRGGSIKHPDMNKILNISIPIPPIKIQNEIVRILDSFTELTEELTEELTARKKQYEFYKEKLFNSIKNIKLMKLRDVVSGKITDGMHNLPKDITQEGYAPILSALNIHDGLIEIKTSKYVSEKTFIKENERTNISVGDVLLTIVATIGRVAIVDKPLKFLLQRSVAVIKPNKNILSSKYLKYCLETNSIQEYLKTNAHGAAQKGFYVGQIEELEIPVPSLDEQQRIVDILDNFDAYCNDLTKGLPAEIEARQKQYEYYRDKLLTFKVKED